MDIFNIPSVYFAISNVNVRITLAFLFSYLQVLESSSQPQQQIEPDPCSLVYFGSFYLADIFSWWIIVDIYNIPFAYFSISSVNVRIILAFLSCYLQVLESSPQPQQQIEPDPSSSECAVSSWEDFSDSDSLSDDEVVYAISALMSWAHCMYDLIYLIIIGFCVFGVTYWESFCNRI